MIVTQSALVRCFSTNNNRDVTSITSCVDYADKY